MDLEKLASVERQLVDRNRLLYSAYDPAPETLSPSGTVVAGYGGHLFIANGTNDWERQLFGEVRLAPPGIELWTSLLSKRAAKAHELNVRLVNLIAPEKQLALPTFRWIDGPPYPLDNRPLVQILAALPDGAKLAYPLGAFASVQPWCELYWQRNSHWCASGCALAAVSVMNALLEDDSAMISQLSFERAVVRHDLLQHFSSDAPAEEVIRIRRSGRTLYEHLPYRTTGRHHGSHYILRNEDASVAEKLVVFGDSYALDQGLAAALSAFFLEVHFIWSHDTVWSYVIEHSIRNVLWQSAERFLCTVPNE